MKAFQAAAFIFLLFGTGASIRWPRHTICKTDRLEIDYRSCDPLQDFAFSVDDCSSVADQSVTVRIALILRHNIKELSVDVSLNVDGNYALVYSKQLCEPNNPQLSFCGKKKGEHIYYEGPASMGSLVIPEGDLSVAVELFNEDHLTIVCANITIQNH